MRVLVSPDCFTGTLSAVEVADAIKAGWLLTKPHDDVVCIPMSDGGPGFVDVVHSVFGGELIHCDVRGPLDESIQASYVISGGTAWIESAQACGLHLIDPNQRNPEVTSSFGLGQLIRDAVVRDVKNIVIGLGGSGTNDAGAGLLSALGAYSSSADLDHGPKGFASIDDVNLDAPRSLLSGITLTVATDVDNPLLGLRGATNVFGPQKGASEEAVMRIEGALENFSYACGLTADGKNPAVALGSGAAGGIGYAVLLLGGNRVAGIHAIMDMLNFDEAVAKADLVITGEGKLDDQSLHGKVVIGVAQRTGIQAKPCIALAGDVRLGKRECLTSGIDAAYSLIDHVGKETALAHAGPSLTSLASKIALTWSL